jgi:hypothetical protein
VRALHGGIWNIFTPTSACLRAFNDFIRPCGAPLSVPFSLWFFIQFCCPRCKCASNYSAEWVRCGTQSSFFTALSKHNNSLTQHQYCFQTPAHSPHTSHLFGIKEWIIFQKANPSLGERNTAGNKCMCVYWIFEKISPIAVCDMKFAALCGIGTRFSRPRGNCRRREYRDGS